MLSELGSVFTVVLLFAVDEIVFGFFQALYFTGNYNADLAAAWIFENQDKNLDAEFNEVILVHLLL